HAMRRVLHVAYGVRGRARRCGCSGQTSHSERRVWQCHLLLRRLDHRRCPGATGLHRTQRPLSPPPEAPRPPRLPPGRRQAPAARRALTLAGLPALALGLLLGTGTPVDAQALGDAQPYGGGSPPPDDGGVAPHSGPDEAPGAAPAPDEQEMSEPAPPPV